MTFEKYFIIIIIIIGIIFLIIKQIKKEIKFYLLKLKNNYSKIMIKSNLSNYDFNLILNEINKINEINYYLY
jgi:hypothetical protein